MREIRGWMVRTGRTYADLARELGMSKSYLINIVAGRKRCSLALALKWSALSGLDIAVFGALLRPSKGDAA